MARLTDNTGRLLGGLDAPLARLLSGDSGPTLADIKAPATPPRPPEYAPDEVVFALECSYGALAYLAYSAAAGAAPSPERRKAPPRDCGRSVEEPHERYHCPACGGSYCAVHAAPAAHDCASVVQR